MENYEIDIIIDNLTDCLIESKTGKKVQTEYRLRVKPFRKKDYSGWKFDWSKPQNDGFLIYELFLKGDNEVQGRVAFELTKDHVEGHLMETAPHNFGHQGKYEGVGGHLFAIMCKASLDNGTDGVVAFYAKNKLINHYIDSFGASVIGGNRMFINEIVAQALIKQYL